MSEYREMWAARKQAAETAMNDADARELKTLSTAYRKARDVAQFFCVNTDNNDSLNLFARLCNSSGYQDDAVNALLRATIPKNKELADSIWEECLRNIRNAKETNVDLLAQNLRTINSDMPTDLG